jgi:DNA recombination protein RmuC
MAVGTIIGFLVGVLLGGLGVGLSGRRTLARERDQRAEQQDALAQTTENLKGVLTELTLAQTERLQRFNLDQMGQQRVDAERQLDAKKALIDTELKRVTKELDGVRNELGLAEKSRSVLFADLSRQMQDASAQYSNLAEQTASLRGVLASQQARGQWGERMADDVLRAVGMVEHVNYERQQSLPGDHSGRPDFTFSLPHGQVVNMDVKFPMAAYLRMLETEEAVVRDGHRKQFLLDVRKHIKDLGGKDYVNAQQNTVDYVLMFIPNESLFSFIHDQDPEMIDRALGQKVILCSPITLFAVLAVIRQAVQVFGLEQRSKAVQDVLAGIRSEWQKFIAAYETVGTRLQSTRNAYDDLTGRRTRQMDKQFAKIEALERGGSEPEQVVDRLVTLEVATAEVDRESAS